jgi:flagellar hook-associated protein 3 FlgL
MINRISTAGTQSVAISEMLRRQTQLAKTQSQVASGQRIQTPADDPVATTRILGIEQLQAQLAQYDKNSDVIAGRLGVGEQALADVGTLLQRVRELALKANSGALDSGSLKSIATELKSRVGELVDVSNRRDTNGEYLFAGYSSQVQPFARGATGVGYAGDQGVRLLQVSATQKLADGLNGESVFMDVPEGNGTFKVTTGVHTGTGTVEPGQVTDLSAWVRGNYTIEFTAPGTWRVLDGGGNPLLDGGGNPVTGNYIDGGVVAFNGIQVKVTGAPAAGDTFIISPAGSEDLFKTLDSLIAALDRGSDTPGSRALLGSDINKALVQLDQGMNHVIDQRAEIGARLAALDSAEQARDDLDFQLASSHSQLADLDYAEAISRLNQQMAGLQAAQAAYTRIGQLSLFNYL